MALTQQEAQELQEDLAIATYEELLDCLAKGPDIMRLIQDEINKRNTIEAPEQLDLFQ